MRELTTLQLNKVLKENPVTKRYYIGTFPGCILPSSKAEQYSFITNTDLHHEYGEHWNAWMVHGNQITFFDSFGRNPKDSSFPQIYKTILKQFEQFEYINVQIQDFMSFTCGYYCIHFIYALSLGLDLDFFLHEYTSDFMKMIM